jgi:hypothetical protein
VTHLLTPNVGRKSEAPSATSRAKESDFKKVVAFLKKSSAKDFCNLYTGISNVPRRKTCKSFLVLFFKKELLGLNFFVFLAFPTISLAATIPVVGCALDADENQ